MIELLMMGSTRPKTPFVAAPTDVLATAVSPTEIIVEWTDNTNADSFYVRRSLNGTDWTDITDTLAPSYLDEELTPETLYYYQVRAVKNGISSEFSATANATTQATAPPPSTDIYIDPTNVLSGRDGSIENPYNSFAEAGFASGNAYRLKAGTEIVLSSELNFSGHTATVVSRYGDGVDPKIKSTVSGTCAIRFAGSTACVLDHIDLYSDLSNSLVTLIQMGTGTAFDGGNLNVITNCKIHGAKQGSSDGGIGIRGGGTNISILNNEIYDTGADGMYLAGTTNLEIGYCNIHHVNQNYAGAGKGFLSLGTGAAGDAIQLDGLWTNFHVHHCILDRSDVYTGSKFCLILNSSLGTNSASGGIVEHNTFYMRSGGDMDWMLYCEQGNGVTVRYNIFNGPRNGIRLSGAYAMNYLIHHNIFDGCPNVCAAAYFNDGGTTGSKFYNNTCYQKTTEGTYFIWSDRAYLDVQNNIFYRSNSSKVALYSFGGSTWAINNNCYNESGMAGTPGAGTGSVVGNPDFVDAANGDFHLQSTSPCRNAGIDVDIEEDFDGVAIPQETNPAIGAFEYVAP